MSQPPPRSTSKANLGDIAARERARRLLGTVISGRYRIVDLLAMGGVGAVYLGEHVRMHKQVAIKVLHPDAQSLPDIAARFEREAVAGAHIAHPNVAVATDFGELEDGGYFLVLEYVRGRTLREVMKRGPLPVGRAVAIGRQIAAALGATHAKGIVHRDLKPRNVMLADGERDTVKLIDFGLAKLSVKEVSAVAAARQSMAEHQITGTGAVFGTIAYLAPEGAIHGMDTVDARADLYALGLVLYEMLTGKHPFDTVDPIELFKRHAKAPPPPFATRAPEVSVPPALEAVVMRLLAKSRDERHPTAEAVIAALDAAWDGTSVSPTPGPVSVTEGVFPGPSLLPPPSSVPPEPPRSASSPPVSPPVSPSEPRASAPAPAPVASEAPAPAEAPAAEAPAVEAPTSEAPAPAPARRPVLPSEPAAAPFSSALAPAPAPRWPYLAIAGGLVLGAAAIFWPGSETAPPSGTTPIASTSAPPVASPPPLVPPPLVPPAPSPPVTASAAASASAAPAAKAAEPPSMPPAEARIALRKTVEGRDWARARDAFFALAAGEPSAFHEPGPALAARDLASASAFAGSHETDRVFRVLGHDLGSDGLDVLYEIVRVRGGSKAAALAEATLREPGVIDKATPALRITWALRDAPCPEKAPLLDRAVSEGDARTLVVMNTVVLACLGPQNDALKAATAALKKRAW